jgi:soluble lytic murein transglycosylase
MLGLSTLALSLTLITTPWKTQENTYLEHSIQMIKVAQQLDGYLGKYAVKEAIKYHVKPSLVLAVMNVESKGQPNAISSVGAVGPMQLMPATARGLLHVDPWNPRDNIRGGVKFLKELLIQFNGNTDLALAAYNSGPQNVIDNGYKVPYYCRGYVQNVEYIEHNTR